MPYSKTFRFLDWEVYKTAKAFCKSLLPVIWELPKEFRLELGSQLIRSSTSILLNIAEGSGKKSDRELNRYFDIAIGSAHETLAHLDFLRDNGFVKEEVFDRCAEELESICRQLGGFKKLLRGKK